MKDNISVIKKDECCGCSACYASCPTKAILMKPDEEGFLYPFVNEENCISCGKCLRVCKDVKFHTMAPSIYACWSVDNSLRAKSSSGGVFSHLAKYILNKGGSVCAVGYSSDCKECLHKIVTKEEELDDLRRAKFVQSKKYDIFVKIKEYLDTGKQLLYCGTPCEVGGVKQFLAKEYNNLITCDIICGCVSSPMVYRTYIEYLNEKYHSEAISVNFKDKRKGWRGKAIAVEFKNGEEYYNSILDDDYCVSFHSRYNIRPSCFNCKYRNLQRTSDLTLGDFWAIEKYEEAYDDNRGTSFVLASTSKGEDILKSLDDLVLHKMDINYEEYVSKYNWCMHRNPTGMPQEDRRIFYEDVKTLPFDIMAKKDLEIIKQQRKLKKLQSKQVTK